MSSTRLPSLLPAHYCQRGLAFTSSGDGRSKWHAVSSDNADTSLFVQLTVAGSLMVDCAESQKPAEAIRGYMAVSNARVQLVENSRYVHFIFLVVGPLY